MRDLGRWLLIALAVVTTAVMAVGYAFVFSGIATPVRGDRATLDLPVMGDVRATILDDGLPVFVVNDPELGVWVLGAQAPGAPSRIGVAVVWCREIHSFVDPAGGSVYAPDGELRWGRAAGGLVAFATRPAADRPSRVVVGSATTVQGRRPETDGPPDSTCNGDGWVGHQPQGDEIFDPSVAVDQEPPGWIWLEGTVRVVDDEVRLCDGLPDGCERFAETLGIDPASVGDGATGARARFIGRVRDDALEGLILVPDMTEAP
jgi:hypothetical protein